MSMQKNPFPQFIMVFCCLLSGISFPGFSQTERQNLPKEFKHKTIVTEPSTLYKGYLRAGLVYSHGFSERFFDPDAKKQFIFGSSSIQARAYMASLQYGITNRIQINLILPYIADKIHFSQVLLAPWADTSSRLLYKQNANGLGDLEAGLYFRILNESEQMPSITLKTQMRIPTGEKNPTHIEDAKSFRSPSGTGEARLAADLQIRKIVYPFSFSVTGSYNYYFGGNKIFVPYEDATSFKTGNLLYVDANLGFLINDWLALVNDIGFLAKSKDEIDGSTEGQFTSWTVIYNPYLYFQIKRLRLAQSVEFPLAGKVYTADPRYTLIVQYIF